MIVNFEDYLLEELLNESLVNEKINLDKINSILKKIGNKTEFLHKLIKKFNEAENLLVKQHLATILIVVFFGSVIMKNGLYSDASGSSGVGKAALEVAKKYNNEILDIKNLKKIKDITYPILFSRDSSVFKLRPQLFENIPGIDVDRAKVSNSTKEFIKEHEKLRLEAYDIGDGHITIGYGHATLIKNSKYKVGDKITEKEANRLFLNDIKLAEDGVKRMLKRWKNENINVKITQSMYDSMVSMAFNMGVHGFVTCDFLDDLKNSDYKAAAEKIKTARINGKVMNEDGEWEIVEMPGLLDRRMTEYKLFISDIA